MRATAVAGTSIATGLVYRHFQPIAGPAVQTAKLEGIAKPIGENFRSTEPLTSFESITNYNNFYEFSLDKAGVAKAAAHFDTAGWKVEVDGLCNRPTTFDLDSLKKSARPRSAFTACAASKRGRW